MTRSSKRPAPFSFVTEGVAAAVQKARNVAGQREVKVMGAEVARQVLALGLADRIELQLSPLLLHEGARLFDGLDKTGLRFTLRGPVVATSVAHLTLDVIRG